MKLKNFCFIVHAVASGFKKLLEKKRVNLTIFIKAVTKGPKRVS